MAITTSNSTRVKARHGYRRTDGLRTPAQRFASRGYVFISRSVVVGLGCYFSSSGAVPLSRELDPLFRSEVRKPPRRIGRTEHLARLGAVVWTRGWTRLGSLGQRGGAVRIKVGVTWRFRTGARARFGERMSAPCRSEEPQSTGGEQRCDCQGQMFCFHCLFDSSFTFAAAL